jgi:hypothetical protein
LTEFVQSRGSVVEARRLLWRGEPPDQAPVKFELLINSKTAKMLGLTVSPTLLLALVDVIE